MYAAASAPVVIGDDRAHLTITVTAPSVVGYLEEQPQDDLEATVCRLLELGVDTARRIDQRADAVGLDDVRNALTSDLAAIRAEIGASIDHLTKVATTVTDRVSVTSAEAEKTIRSQVAALPEQLRQVISDATADPALAAAVSDALKGDDSPIRKLEQRLAADLGRAAQANDARSGCSGGTDHGRVRIPQPPSRRTRRTAPITRRRHRLRITGRERTHGCHCGSR